MPAKRRGLVVRRGREEDKEKPRLRSGSRRPRKGAIAMTAELPRSRN
jgi:hypothetical protein